MLRKKLYEIRAGIKMIKKVLTLRVKFNNILGAQKYKKETIIPKEKTCVLGISKL